MKTILIIDDDPLIARILQPHLKAAGYGVQAAADAAQGLRVAVTEKPDLILLDLQMPAGGGAATFGSLRRNHNTALIPVIFITANQDPEVRKACMASGAVDYVTKPVEPADLVARVRRALGDAPPADEPDSPGNPR